MSAEPLKPGEVMCFCHDPNCAEHRHEKRVAATIEALTVMKAERDAALGSEAAMREALAKLTAAVEAASTRNAKLSIESLERIEVAMGVATTALASRPTGYRSPEAVRALLMKGMEALVARCRGAGFAAAFDLSALVAELLKEGESS